MMDGQIVKEILRDKAASSPTHAKRARLRPAWPATHFAGRARDRRVGGLRAPRSGGVDMNDNHWAAVPHQCRDVLKIATL